MTYLFRRFAWEHNAPPRRGADHSTQSVEILRSHAEHRNEGYVVCLLVSRALVFARA
jgi:hypothetical protein